MGFFYVSGTGGNIIIATAIVLIIICALTIRWVVEK